MTENVRFAEWKSADPFFFRLTSSRTNLGFAKSEANAGRRARSATSKAERPECNWPNFLSKKSPFAIKTANAFCSLTREEQIREVRPAFGNFGAGFVGRKMNEKQTFNATSIHQIKHAQANDQRIRQIFRERRAREQNRKFLQTKFQKNNETNLL